MVYCHGALIQWRFVKKKEATISSRPLSGKKAMKDCLTDVSARKTTIFALKLIQFSLCAEDFLFSNIRVRGIAVVYHGSELLLCQVIVFHEFYRKIWIIAILLKVNKIFVLVRVARRFRTGIFEQFFVHPEPTVAGIVKKGEVEFVFHFVI